MNEKQQMTEAMDALRDICQIGCVGIYGFDAPTRLQNSAHLARACMQILAAYFGPEWRDQ